MLHHLGVEKDMGETAGEQKEEEKKELCKIINHDQTSSW